MELDVLYSDHDSEDELDHDVADFEDRTVRCCNPLALLMQKLGTIACFRIQLSSVDSFIKYLILIILTLLSTYAAAWWFF